MSSVTVVIPCYNASAFVCDAVNSAPEQTESVEEIVNRTRASNYYGIKRNLIVS